MSETRHETEELAEALGGAILTGLDPAAHDDLSVVRRAAAAQVEVDALLRQAVGAARAAGHSWAALGGELGMSRQAAQQRFGERRDAPETTSAEERWLGPVTALNELAELEIAGRQGWRTVGAGMLKHLVRRTPTQWEHRRIMWGPVRRWEADGWEVAVRAFPWIYLARDTGRPAASPPAKGA